MSGSDSVPAEAHAGGAPLADIVAEAQRLLAGAQAANVPIRLLGGLAVRLRAATIPPALQREYKDIDLVAPEHASHVVETFIASAGYAPEPEFNALNGHRRLLFFDTDNERRLDVFVGEFAMCHSIAIAERLDVDMISIPLAELLLTKLQVVELNERDLQDILVILHNHPVAEDDGAINGARVAELCAADWGLWRTATMNLDRVEAGVTQYPLPAEERERIARGIQDLKARIDGEPKSRRWKLRSRIGDRKRWYELPEEVD